MCCIIGIKNDWFRDSIHAVWLYRENALSSQLYDLCAWCMQPQTGSFSLSLTQISHALTMPLHTLTITLTYTDYHLYLLL